MPDTLPFAVSAEVEEWLLQIPLLPDKQPGLSCCPCYGVKNRDGEALEEFLEEHYVIAHTMPDAWRSVHAIQVEIGPRQFWFLPDTLDKLRGKTLRVIRTDVSKLPQPKIRSFVVAI